MKFYVTTPIYYVNDLPHIGHAYTSLAADTLSIWNRMKGNEVFFLTGTDEHGQKVQQAAESRGLSPQEHTDKMVRNFKQLWSNMNLSNDAFIRTTDNEHKEIVSELLTRLWERGEIVKRTYEGWYCTPCERFWTEKDLEDGKCPDCKREVEQIQEDNYFFLMSKYSKQLVKHIEDNPTFILPETRRNEVLGFLRTKELGDLCISRPKKRLSWGIPLPFDSDYVTYVWFDALINYYSATRCLAPTEDVVCKQWWPAEVQIIGKDILTTHAVYWSTMLMAMELPLPQTIFAHGWWTVDGQKMSKSLGNVVDPASMVDKYGNDAFRFFLFREVSFGLDGDFSEDSMVGRINTDLANDLGNLASRAMKMAENYFDGKVPEPESTEDEFSQLANGMLSAVDGELKVLRFQKALDEIWKLVTLSNKYIDSNAPWALAKDPEQKGRLATVIYTSLEALRLMCVYLHPFLPSATQKLHAALGQTEDILSVPLDGATKWGVLKPGTVITKPESLFPRIQKPKQQQPQKTKKKEKHKMIETDKTQTEEIKSEAQPKQEQPDNLIGIDQFAKVELKTGKILEAERVPKSNKLLRLQVDTGEMRQIVAGIAKAYEPDDLVGRTVIIVTNLKPAKLMGVESQGMLLAATDADGQPSVLSPDRDVAPGTRIK